MKTFTVKEDVFKTEPLFVLGLDFEAFRRHMKARYRQDVGLDIGQCGQMLTYDKAPWRVVWSEQLDVGILVHEILHLVTRICQDKGVPIRAYNDNGEIADETAAYLMEYFTVRAMRKIRKTVRVR